MSRDVPATEAMNTAALILAGGRSTRLNDASRPSPEGGPVDKAAVEIDGLPLIEHVYAAVAGCAPIVAVGPDAIARPGVRVVREDPPFGGPAAAVAAGIAALDGPTTEVWLLSCDLPRANELVALLAAVPTPDDVDGVAAVDIEGRMQWLAGRYRVAALRDAVAQHPETSGLSMRKLFEGLRLRTVDDDGTAIDLDTWAAIEAYRRTRKDNHV